MKLFTIKDMKADYYHQPQFYRTSAEAIRACKNAVISKQGQTPFNMNPEDFALFEIGEWDELAGNVTVKDKKHVQDLIDLKDVD